jgi:hypothetical protein
MATRKELIYDIKEYLKQYSDDNDYPNRYIEYLWNKKRSKYLRRLLNDLTRKFDEVIQQQFCMDLELVPDLLEIRSRSGLISVGPTDFTMARFKMISLEEVPNIFHKPFALGIYAFLNTDGHLYIISKKDSHKLLKCVTVIGVFEDPFDVEGFFDCCDCENPTTCFPDDAEYPIQGFLIDEIRMEIIKELVPREQIQQDERNNSDEN